MQRGKAGYSKTVGNINLLNVSVGMIQYRENALKALNSMESLQSGLRIVESKSVVSLLALIAALFAVLVWGLLGAVSIELPAQGLLLPVKQIEQTEAIYQSYRQARENELSQWQTLLANKQKLYNQHLVTMDDLARSRRDYLNAIETKTMIPKLIDEQAGNLFSVKTSAAGDMAAIVFVSHNDGKQIKQGMHAYLLPAFMSPYSYGYIKGTVSHVSEFPASKESVYPYLGNMNLVDDYFVGGAPFVLRINLDKNAKTATGYNWTSRLGAPDHLGAGSAVQVKILKEELHPYQLFRVAGLAR